MPGRREEGDRGKMEFDKSRAHSAVNADELKPGDKVIVADVISRLKEKVKTGSMVYTLKEVYGEAWSFRFSVPVDETPGVSLSFALAYLVERKENCTNCMLCERTNSDDEEYECSPSGYIGDKERAKIHKCSNWTLKAEQKTEHDCKSCRYKNCGFKDFNTRNDCDRWEAEPKTRQKAEPRYRPFKDTDELIEEWDKKLGYRDPTGLAKPYIWVRRKTDLKNCGHLVTDFSGIGVTVQGQGYAMSGLFANFEFLDGSPCGVEE